MENTGLTIALTPGQLAAILSGGTLDGRPGTWTRIWGGGKLVFGALEELGAGGLLLAPEPTMVTKAAGVGLGLHGADTLQSGARQIWTGRETSTLTSASSAALARALGVDEETARRIGEGVDLAVPAVFTLGAGAVRIAAVRGGRIVLAEHEAATLRGIGGHTIARHVGLTDAELLERLRATGYRTVSTFNNLEEAERAITNAIRSNHGNIVKWARTAEPGSTTPFHGVFAQNGVGRVLIRNTVEPVAGKSIRLILKKEAYNEKLYYILTAFPLP